MKGGYVHEHILLDRLQDAARRLGLSTARQLRTANGGYVDLLLESASSRIAVEAELTPRRVLRDVAKAAVINANELWIVVPTVRQGMAVQRLLDRMPPPVGQVFVLTLGGALQRLTDCFSKNPASLRDPTNKEQKG